MLLLLFNDIMGAIGWILLCLSTRIMEKEQESYTSAGEQTTILNHINMEIAILAVGIFFVAKYH